MEINLGGELTAWLDSPGAQEKLREIVRDAIREELRTVLGEELLTAEDAAKLLHMSVPALRKAVERGQVACVRIGRRVRFRRSDLIQMSESRE